MPEAVFHQMVMLRPMQAGVSGYARVQGEAGRQLVQINLRGLRGNGMHAYWYAGDGLVRDLGRRGVNARGEAGLYTDLPADVVAPARLTALLITDGEPHPRPLAIGLYAPQSAGSLMDARNALLALCDKLNREAALKPEPEPAAAMPAAPAADAAPAAVQPQTPAASPPEAAPVPPVCGAEAAHVQESPAASASVPARNRRKPFSSLPREVFLPAIAVQRERRRSRKAQDDTPPQPTAGAAAPEHIPPQPTSCPAAPDDDPLPPAGCPAAETAAVPLRRSTGAPADRLPRLHWPESFAEVAAYFDRCLPVPLLPWSGWRFVQVQQGEGGLWIGCQRRQGRIVRIAYALPREAAVPAGKPFRPVRTQAGQEVQVLVLRA